MLVIQTVVGLALVLEVVLNIVMLYFLMIEPGRSCEPLWTDLRKGLCVGRVLNCEFACDSLIVLRRTCAVDRTLESNY